MDSFLECGTVTNPAKSYHLEFVCDTGEQADRITDIARGYNIVCGRMERKGCCIVYLKDSEAISDILTVMGATNARLRYEDIRVVREMRLSVQRRVNCETANISKTVSASIKQLEDIMVIKDSIGLDKLPEGLREVAELRISNPDAALSDLAELMPDLGRSGINHRFRKIAAIAARIKAEGSAGAADVSGLP